MNTEKKSKTPIGVTLMDVDYLSRFVTETGKIMSRSVTGLTAKQQRRITKAIKQARNMLLMK